MTTLRDKVRAASNEAAKKITAELEASGAFEPYRNADGTYNGVKMFADLTGLSEADVAAIFKNAQARRAR